MNKVAIIASLAAGLALQQVANAGIVYPSPISIYYYGSSGVYAIGSFHQALLSSDSREFIGCSVTNYIGWNELICEARNAAGESASCYTESPSQPWVQAAGAINEYSLVRFEANSSGQCTLLGVDNSTYNK